MRIKTTETKSKLALLIIVTMLLGIFSPAMAAGTDRAVGFTDIENHWAKDTIIKWTEEGLIKGYEDGKFKPDNNISRAEFMAAINRALGFNEEATIEFSDVGPDDWFYADVAKAVKAGYIEGYEDGSARPNQDISRQEAAVALSRALGIAVREQGNQFTDGADIADWSLPYINALTEKGYIEGYLDGSFQAQRSISRAEAVTMLDKARADIEEDIGGEESEPEEDGEDAEAPDSGGGSSSSGNGGSSGSVKVIAISVDDVPVVGMTIRAKDLKPEGANVNYQWQRALMGSEGEYGEFENIEGATDATYKVDKYYGCGSAPGNGFVPMMLPSEEVIRLKVTGTGRYRGTVYSDPIGPVVYGTGAKFTATHNIGIAPDTAGEAAGKIFAEYELRQMNNGNGAEISLKEGEIDYIKVQTGDENWRELEPNTDETLWFNVEADQGVRTFVVKVTENGDAIYYTATLNWNEEIKDATWLATDREGTRPDTDDTYVEYKLVDSADDPISLKIGEVKLIAQKVEGKWKELTPNTDKTLWFFKDADAGEREFFVVTNDGTMYKAILDWQGGDNYKKDVARAAIQPSWGIKSIKGICESTEGCDAEHSEEVMAKSDLPEELKDEDIGYQMTIGTSYENTDAAKASGRSVTTLFTVPDDVTVWYPVWQENGGNYEQSYVSAEGNGDDGWFALGMVGHPLNEGDITADAEVYVDLGSAASNEEFKFNIKLVDAVWEDVIYGEQDLTVTRSQYEFGVTYLPESIPAVGSLTSGKVIKVIGNNGGGLNEPGDAAYEALGKAVFDNEDAFLQPYLVKVTLKATTVGDFGYTNKSVRIKELGVQDKDGNDASDKLKVYLYAHNDRAWYDLVQTGWGLEGAGKGFNLYKDEDTTLEAYVFGKPAGTYEITFEAVDMSTESTIATYTAEVTVKISVSPLEQSYYAAEVPLSFTISGLEPNIKENISMMIYSGGPQYDIEPVDLEDSMNRVSPDGKTEWFGTTDEYGKLTVSGTVNPNLPYGELHIILPNHGGNINNSIPLQDNDGKNVYVGNSD